MSKYSLDDIHHSEMDFTILIPTRSCGVEDVKSTWTNASSIFEPPCACEVCSMQYRSIDQQKRKKSFQYSGSMSTREVQTSSTVLSTRLHKDLTAAQSLFRVHEKLIHDKWMAKNNAKRKSHLLQLRPSMHYDQDAFLAVLNSPLPPEDAVQLRRDHKDLFLLPYMTIDTLAKDASRVLRLLHYRLFHTPEEWVPFDNIQILAGWRGGVLAERFNDGCIILSDPFYGKWTPFSASDGKFRDKFCIEKTCSYYRHHYLLDAIR